MPGGRYPLIPIPQPDLMGSMGDLARLAMLPGAMRRQSQEADIEGLKLKEMKDAQAESDLVKQALADNGGDPESALSYLRGQGAVGVSAAGKLQTQIRDAHRTAIDDQLKGLDIASKRFGVAGQLIRGVEEAPEDQRPDAWAQALPQVKETLGPQLGQHVPDTYDPAWVSRAMTWGETAKDTLERRQAALAMARDKALGAKDAREADEYWTKSLGAWLPTTESQDEWDQAMKFAKGAGATDATLAKFGPVWSDDAIKRADTFSMTPEERARHAGNTDFDKFLRASPDDQKTLLEARKQWEGAGRGPTANRFVERGGQILWLPPDQIQQGDKPVTASSMSRGELSPNTLASLKRWKATEIERINANVMLQQDPEAQSAALTRINSAYDDIVKAAPNPGNGTVPDYVKNAMGKGDGTYTFKLPSGATETWIVRAGKPQKQ